MRPLSLPIFSLNESDGTIAESGEVDEALLDLKVDVSDLNHAIAKKPPCPLAPSPASPVLDVDVGEALADRFQ